MQSYCGPTVLFAMSHRSHYDSSLFQSCGVKEMRVSLNSSIDSVKPFQCNFEINAIPEGKPCHVILKCVLCVDKNVLQLAR